MSPFTPNVKMESNFNDYFFHLFLNVEARDLSGVITVIIFIIDCSHARQDLGSHVRASGAHLEDLTFTE